MISLEVLVIVIVGLSSITLYSMYRYFDDLICSITKTMDYYEENGRFGLKCEKEVLNKRIDLLEQKLKDGLQSNAICNKSAIDRINSRLNSLESISSKRTKKDEGSITVVMPEISESRAHLHLKQTKQKENK